MLESQPEAAIVAPTEGSHVGIPNTMEANTIEDGRSDGDGDSFDGVDWRRLGKFMKPSATQRRVRSCVYQYGHHAVQRDSLIEA